MLRFASSPHLVRGLLRVWIVIAGFWGVYWTWTEAPRDPFGHIGCAYRLGYNGGTQQQFMYNPCWSRDEVEKNAAELASGLNGSARQVENGGPWRVKLATTSQAVASEIAAFQNDEYRQGVGAIIRYILGLVKVPALIAAVLVVAVFLAGWLAEGFNR